VAILSLALGVGANSAIFQLLNAVRIRTCPVKDPRELVGGPHRGPPGGAPARFNGRYPQLTNPLWEQVRDKAEGFSVLAAWGTVALRSSDGGRGALRRRPSG
jgi:hypothetical protein